MGKLAYSAIQRANPQHRNQPKKWYAQLKTYSCIGYEAMKETVARNSQIDSSVIAAVMGALATEIQNFVYNGHNVKLDGLGTFSLALGTRPSLTKESVTGDKVIPKTIRFRMAGELKRECSVKKQEWIKYNVPEMYRESSDVPISYLL